MPDRDSFRRHMVYLYLLFRCFWLYEQDARRIRAEWGLTDLEMWYEGIVSMPTECTKLIACDAISREFNLEGIAGFYTEGDRWRINLNHRTGLLKPYRDSKKQISGLLVYRNTSDRDPHLLTSRDLPNGSKAILNRRLALV